ncbi:MAG: hypothetical protein IAX21_03860 [Candidatus Bathyarchaeota archaeon]|nr:MAG: hypothetical protein IAX21_03860 [Candidatus Bathyarchaeota archaeon]
MWITIFKLAQFITMGIFVVFISDFRQKNGMVPLINEKITQLLKFTYFGPVIISAYTLTTMNYLTMFDFTAFTLTVLGTIAVVKSKRDLGIAHTWAGYCSKTSKLEVTGIYAYIRHPLYTGVFLFSIGALATLLIHAPWYMTAIAFSMGLLMVLFLAITASKETNYLTQNLGEHFINYKRQVHPFLPLKKYT